MNNQNLKEQFLGFYQTPSLFNNPINDLGHFEFEQIDLESFDFSNLEITQKIPLGKRAERYL